MNEAQTIPTSKPGWFIGVVTLAAWFAPGLGHLLLRRFSRAAAFFLVVGGLATLGVVLRGNIFSYESGDLFDILGFLADAGSGVFYLAGRMLELGNSDVSRAAGDYGTRFFAAAGVLNFICVLDAHEIARGRKG